jgi:hypothetical protein
MGRNSSVEYSAMENAGTAEARRRTGSARQSARPGVVAGVERLGRTASGRKKLPPA